MSLRSCLLPLLALSVLTTAAGCSGADIGGDDISQDEAEISSKTVSVNSAQGTFGKISASFNVLKATSKDPARAVLHLTTETLLRRGVHEVIPGTEGEPTKKLERRDHELTATFTLDELKKYNGSIPLAIAEFDLAMSIMAVDFTMSPKGAVTPTGITVQKSRTFLPRGLTTMINLAQQGRKDGGVELVFASSVPLKKISIDNCKDVTEMLGTDGKFVRVQVTLGCLNQKANVAEDGTPTVTLHLDREAETMSDFKVDLKFVMGDGEDPTQVVDAKFTEVK